MIIAGSSFLITSTHRSCDNHFISLGLTTFNSGKHKTACRAPALLGEKWKNFHRLVIDPKIFLIAGTDPPAGMEASCSRWRAQWACAACALILFLHSTMNARVLPAFKVLSVHGEMRISVIDLSVAVTWKTVRKCSSGKPLASHRNQKESSSCLYTDVFTFICQDLEWDICARL